MWPSKLAAVTGIATWRMSPPEIAFVIAADLLQPGPRRWE